MGNIYDPERYQVGDTKCIDLDGMTSTNNNGCNGGFLVRLVNKPASDYNACTMSIVDYSFIVEFVDVVISGREVSNLSLALDEIEASLPSDLKHRYPDVYLPSFGQIFGNLVTSGRKQLDYYANNNVTTADVSYAKKKYNNAVSTVQRCSDGAFSPNGTIWFGEGRTGDIAPILVFLARRDR